MPEKKKFFMAESEKIFMAEQNQISWPEKNRFFLDISPENFRNISGIISGHFPEHFRKNNRTLSIFSGFFSENLRNISGNISGNFPFFFLDLFRNISGTFPRKLPDNFRFFQDFFRKLNFELGSCWHRRNSSSLL